MSQLVSGQGLTICKPASWDARSSRCISWPLQPHFSGSNRGVVAQVHGVLRRHEKSGVAELPLFQTVGGDAREHAAEAPNSSSIQVLRAAT